MLPVAPGIKLAGGCQSHHMESAHTALHNRFAAQGATDLHRSCYRIRDGSRADLAIAVLPPAVELAVACECKAGESTCRYRNDRLPCQRTCHVHRHGQGSVHLGAVSDHSIFIPSPGIGFALGRRHQEETNACRHRLDRLARQYPACVHRHRHVARQAASVTDGGGEVPVCHGSPGERLPIRRACDHRMLTTADFHDTLSQQSPSHIHHHRAEASGGRAITQLTTMIRAPTDRLSGRQTPEPTEQARQHKDSRLFRLHGVVIVTGLF